ncbi:MAG: hypothetical protein AAF195_00585 [Pseudomonadota bacterium]
METKTVIVFEDVLPPAIQAGKTALQHSGLAATHAMKACKSQDTLTLKNDEENIQLKLRCVKSAAQLDSSNEKYDDLKELIAAASSDNPVTIILDHEDANTQGPFTEPLIILLQGLPQSTLAHIKVILNSGQQANRDYQQTLFVQEFEKKLYVVDPSTDPELTSLFKQEHSDKNIDTDKKPMSQKGLAQLVFKQFDLQRIAKSFQNLTPAELSALVEQLGLTEDFCPGLEMMAGSPPQNTWRSRFPIVSSFASYVTSFCTGGTDRNGRERAADRGVDR